MRLVRVNSGSWSWDPTCMDLELVIGYEEGDDGALREETVMYTFRPNFETVGITPQLDAWWIEFQANPTFEILPYVKPEFNPSSVDLTPGQFRMGLLKSGVSLSAISAAVAKDDELQIYFEYITIYRWDQPLTARLLALAFDSEAKASAMWQLASTLEI